MRSTSAPRHRAEADEGHRFRTTPIRTATLNTNQWIAACVALMLAVVGALGFVPGVTTSFSEMKLAGHRSGTELFGRFGFQLGTLRPRVQRVVGLGMARVPSGARGFLVAGGLLYLSVWIYSMLVVFDSSANFLPVNDADNWLHLGLALAMISLGLVSHNRRAPERRRFSGRNLS